MSIREASPRPDPQAPLRATPTWRVVFFLLGTVLFFAPVAIDPNVSNFLVGATFVILIGCTWFDLTEFRVPNALTYPGLLGVLIVTALLPEARGIAAASGAALGGISFVLLGVISRGAVGLGDAKLAAFGGAAVGIDSVLPALLVGSLSALVPVMALLVLGRISRKQALPYAPFLAFGFGLALALGASTFTS